MIRTASRHNCHEFSEMNLRLNHFVMGGVLSQRKTQLHSRLGEVSPHFQSRNHGPWKFHHTSNLAICHNHGWRKSHLISILGRSLQGQRGNSSVLLGGTWLLQQGIRIHKFPLWCLSSTRSLIASFAQPFFPSLRPFIYNKLIFKLDTPTLMYATGRFLQRSLPSEGHFPSRR